MIYDDTETISKKNIQEAIEARAQLQWLLKQT